MLHDMGHGVHAEKIKTALLKTIEQGKFLTKDLGGKSKGTDFTKALINNLE